MKSILLTLVVVCMVYAQAGLVTSQLDLIGETQHFGSDQRSQDFNDYILPELHNIVEQSLGERVRLHDDKIDYMALDPTRLTLQHDSSVRVYFVGEGAGYHNTLGIFTEKDGLGIRQNPMAIFRDASSQQSYLHSSYEPTRTSNEPLLPGDFVDLGLLPQGSFLDLFIISNGARGGQNTYFTDAPSNPDGIPHVVAFALDNTPYLMIGFEDLYGGGDKDYNDLIIALDVGYSNVSTFTSTISLVDSSPTALSLTVPEQSSYIYLAIGLLLYLLRNHTKR